MLEQVGSDQDIADLLSALSSESTTAEGGMYAGALAEPPTAAGTAAPAAGADWATSPVGSDPGHAGLANGGLPGAAANGSASEAAAQQQ